MKPKSRRHLSPGRDHLGAGPGDSGHHHVSEAHHDPPALQKPYTCVRQDPDRFGPRWPQPTAYSPISAAPSAAPPSALGSSTPASGLPVASASRRSLLLGGSWRPSVLSGVVTDGLPRSEARVVLSAISAPLPMPVIRPRCPTRRPRSSWPPPMWPPG